MKKTKKKKPSPTKIEKHTNEKVFSNDGKLYEKTIKETKYYAQKNNSNIILLAFSILSTWLKNTWLKN